MPAPGDRYGRFIVEEILGKGGMATVYRVRHETLGSFHALKVLDLPFPSVRARLIQEGQVQARLRHPHVVAVTDLIDVDGSPGLVMEYVSGPTLDAWLLRNRADAGTATSIFGGVLDGVAFAHREGVVHRDLKPGNVLLHTVDGRVFPKVTDFGLAKMLSGTGTDHHTRTGFAMGTPGYMAPEQVRNAKDVDARTDIFALGCILYEVWCGIPAFPGKDIFATLDLMEARRYTDPRAQRPDVPDPVYAAIRGMLEPERDRRLPSCEAVRAVLEHRPPPAPVSVGTQAAWAGGEGLGSAVTALPAPAPTPRPPEPDPGAVGPFAPATFDPHLPPASLFEPRTTSRATTMGAAAGVGAVFVAGVATLLVCAGVAWWSPMWGTAPDPMATAAPPSVGANEPSSVGPAPPPAVAPSAAPAVDAPRPTSAVDAPRPTRVVTVTPSATAPDPTSTRPVIVTSPAVPVPVVEPAPPEPTPAAPPPVGRFQVNGAVDSAWLESQGRRFGVGNVAPGSYTLHARWGSVEVERKVTVAAGQTLVATCDATFFNCVVR